ncbi:TPA: 50S ribosomal protein L6 [Candidatus Woesearchaeota archaeon]|nr:50S ribosomal protein L6P [uncultured archaeon]HIH11927.1 50S ribosomal protein L6 [Candidatus Woesearchaeota archaeon]
MKIDLQETIELPSGVSASFQGSLLSIKGPKGEVQREFFYPRIAIVVEQGKLVISSPHATKREKTILGSFTAHIKNMVSGVQEHYVYKLKICSGHFPMSVTVAGKEFVIKNFFGETVPRKMFIPQGVKVEVAGTDIIVSGPDKEHVSQMAASIEQLCRISNRDIRTFQDGCYIVQKAGKGVV